MNLSEQYSLQIALAPDADRYNGNPATDIFNMGDGGHIAFWLEEGAGGTGTVKIQVEECSTAAGANNVAIAFRYRVRTAGTWGALTSSASTGYTTTAGADKGVVVEVDANELSPTKPFVRLQLTEVANDPCDAGVVAIIGPTRYQDAGDIDPTS